MINQQDFESNGYAVVEGVVAVSECIDLIAQLPDVYSSGSRTLLAFKPYQALATGLRGHTSLSGLLRSLVAVECIFFNKSTERNWGVGLHRDTVLPIDGSGGWSPSGTKEGMQCVRPARDFMNGCVAVRVQLDGAPAEDISVVPGSHRDSRVHGRANAIAVPVGQGGVLVMRPAIAHASSKLRSNRVRRVLHFVFAPKELPDGYTWYYAA